MEIRLKSIIGNDIMIKNIQNNLLSSKFVSPIDEIYEDQENYYLVQDICSGGSLSQFRSKLNSEQVFIFLHQMILAIQYLHNLKLAHGNLTMNSFHLINNSDSYICKLVVLSKIFEEKQEHKDMQNRIAKDLQAVGIIAYELLQRNYEMMQFKNLMEQNYNIKYEFCFESCVHPKLKNILSNLLNLEQQVDLENILHTIQKRDPIINNATLLQPLYNTLKMKMINQNYFQQQILYFMVTKFQPEYLEVLQRIFNNFDSDKDGILSIQDFQRMYQQIIDDLNLDLVINDVFSKIDASNQGEIKFKLSLLQQIQKKFYKIIILRQLFDIYTKIIQVIFQY